jgi:Sulfotransferase domain
MPTPDFLIIGAMKAGTTSLYNVLKSHPEINMSLVKEPNFFMVDKDRNGTWHLGINWYKNLFRNRLGLTAEASTAYTKFPTVLGIASRIHRINPNVRLIYLVRHPVDRAISHYLHNVIAGHEKRDIHKVLAGANQYVFTSMYFLQLQQYLMRFSKEQICIIVCEHMWANPNATLDRVCRFLGVASIALSDNKMVRRNASGLRTVEQVVDDPTNEAQQQLRLAMLGEPIKDDDSAQALGRALGFGSSERQRLVSRFTDDYQALTEFLGHPINEWDKDLVIDSSLSAR